MPEINYNVLPVPPFCLSEFVERKTKDFITSYLNPRSHYVGDGYKIDDFLTELNQDEHRLQALCILINNAIDVLDTHLNGDKSKGKFPCKREGCDFEAKIQDLLYIYYGKIKYYGVNTFYDSISKEDMFTNNHILNTIKDNLDKLLLGQEIVFDEVDRIAIEQAKQKVEKAKGLQILGKENFSTYLKGLSLELASTAAIVNVYQTTIAPHFNELINALHRLIG